MNARGGVASTSPLGLHTETVRDAMARADSVSGDKWYSGVMLHNKDLRRVVLMVNEYRALTSELAAAKEEIERLKEKARDCERRTFRYGEEAKEAEERAAAAETALASERKETERLRGALEQIAGYCLNGQRNGFMVAQVLIDHAKAALQSRQGEE